MEEHRWQARTHGGRHGGAGGEPRRLVANFSTPGTLAAKNATSTIPIVFSGLSDPVATGLVPSLARPGGNITGMSAVDDEVHGKRLSLLRELLPGLNSIAVLWHPDDVTNRLEVPKVEAAARMLSIQARLVELRRAEDIGARV